MYLYKTISKKVIDTEIPVKGFISKEHFVIVCYSKIAFTFMRYVTKPSKSCGNRDFIDSNILLIVKYTK